MPEYGTFIKIDRKIKSWEWYTDSNTKDVFLHCLLSANWSDGKYKGEDIPKGSFHTTVKDIAAELHMTTQQVRTALYHLQKTNEITIKTTNKFSVITINNWCLYQDNNKQNNNQLTNKQQTNNKQVTNKKDEEERTKEEEELKRIKRREEGKNKNKNKNNNNNNFNNINNINNTFCAEAETSSASPQHTVAKIILNDKSFYEVQKEEIDNWSELYPAVDVMQEIRNMIGWSEANPSKRKTRRGIHKFINNWLQKSQDRGGSQNNRAASNNIANRNLPGGMNYTEWRNLRNEQG